MRALIVAVWGVGVGTREVARVIYITHFLSPNKFHILIRPLIGRDVISLIRNGSFSS